MTGPGPGRDPDRLLRTAFLAGAITDALALVPLLSQPAARLLLGFTECDAACDFARGYAAALMAGWTLLLLWAWRKPAERRLVAPLTIVVILGLATTEIASVARGDLAAARVVPTWVLQAALTAWFAIGYRASRRGGASR